MRRNERNSLVFFNTILYPFEVEWVLKSWTALLLLQGLSSHSILPSAAVTSALIRTWGCTQRHDEMRALSQRAIMLGSISSCWLGCAWRKDFAVEEVVGRQSFKMSSNPQRRKKSPGVWREVIPVFGTCSVLSVTPTIVIQFYNHARILFHQID